MNNSKPVNIDKCFSHHTYNASNPATTDFPELFLPFKNLLRKIRELLLTLAPHEVLVLEMLLCQHEEPANISTKLKEVTQSLSILLIMHFFLFLQINQYWENILKSQFII